MSLEIKNIKKKFFQGETRIDVLKGASLKLNQGEIVSILGESGSGKSTFLSIVSGLERADEGSILINGSDITQMKENDLTRFRAKNISIVFQQYHLLPYLTAQENVAFPLEILKIENANQKAKELLEELSLGHRLNHFPAQLSGGESQRVAIARALLVRPQLLLADEPSGNLDPKTGDAVLDSFFEIVKKYKITTVFVTHSMALAQRCEKVYRLKNGILSQDLA